MMQEAMTCAGGLSSLVFMAQVACQVKVYGFKQWAKLGFGTGVEIERGHVDSVIKAAEHDAESAGRDIEHHL